MKTFLFHNIIFGPVQSRRLGNSLGINLLPTESKLCNFDCVYCECGWTDLKSAPKAVIHDTRVILEAMEEKLKELSDKNERLDSITFAGNGEPTMHPDFDLIIDETIRLRDQYFPNCPISVLSNAMMLHKEKVVRALKKTDQPILKLDAGTERTFQLIDRPAANRTLDWIVKHLAAFGGKLSIQTLLIRGSYNGEKFDNTTDEEIGRWIELLKKIRPEKVMLYSVARNTPADDLEKISNRELQQIAEKVRASGFEVQVN